MDFPTYSYSPLEKPLKDIRLAIILPGRYSDDIRIRIDHIALDTATCYPSRKLHLADIKKSLSSGWDVCETVNGRCLFWRATENGLETTWTHPTPNIEPAFREQDTKAYRPSTGPPFDALSYVWGDRKGSHNKKAIVECFENDQTTWKLLEIGERLSLALRDVRYQDRPHTMWIDAICIDQSNIDERNIQVTRMADIFSQASQVIAWLDPPGEMAEAAIRVLNKIGQSLEMPLWENRVLPSPGSTTNWYHRHFQMPLSDNEWDSILYLCNLQWFRRVWVVQEALLGTTKTILRSGPSDISWNVFGCALSAVTRNDCVSDKVRGAMVRILDLCLFRHEHAPAKRALVLAARRFCSDPRDRVYGLLGILSTGLGHKIQPNYSAPSQEVLTNCALAYIDHVRRLEVLDLCAILRPITKNGPSWVFDPCDENRRQGWYLTLGLWAGQFSTHFSESVAIHTSPDVLSVLGLKVTKVLFTTPRAPAWWDSESSEIDYRSCIRAVRDWEPANLYTATYVTGESLLRAYARTLAFDMLSDRMQSQGYFPSLEQWQEQNTRNALFGDAAKKGEFALPGIPVQERTTITRLFGMRFMTCDNGFIGLGPTETKPDDLICILLGYESPVVLRKQNDGNYKFIGPCYLHGASDGDALLGPLPKPWRVQRFPNSTGHYLVCKFFNPDTGVLCDEDPRLEPLGDHWERLDLRDRTADDPEIFQEFRHKPTGRIFKSDPRLSPEALRKRGVALETFSLA
ncbi:heterokaryon incompatibility protein-domain-containing protein [Xylaria acuta]|nr:heterokaryon incompatibility protein-domain-containing protein [Xylaria acuta]